MRFSGKVYRKLADWDLANLPPEYDPDECLEGFTERCECPTCEHNRRREAFREQMEVEEEAMNARMRKLAELYNSDTR